MTRISPKKNISLAPKTTFGVGERAELFVRAQSPEELIEASLFARAQKIPFHIIAGGSNVVFPDATLKGLTAQFLGGIVVDEENGFVTDAGVPLYRVVSRAIALGFAGLETLTSIPGTVGGAVYGNAGAYGHSIGESVSEVEVFDGRKRIWIKKTPRTFGYRTSFFKHKPYLILRIKFLFKKGDKAVLRKESQRIKEIREKKYPMNLKCPGSFFKNVLMKDVSKKALSRIDLNKVIEGKIPAGYLLDAVGARGMSVGGVCVADYHGNLILNSGKATQKDVLQLAEILKKKVQEKFGILLEEEVRIF